MIIADILRSKGAAVLTIAPEASAAELAAVLAENRIGAVVVVEHDRPIGIVSERDVVRGLNSEGAGVLDASVADLMTTELFTCEPADSVDRISVAMTERRIRHVPVLDGGELAGIVSIGDVVAARIRDLETARGQLESYITQG
ncbi:CBS domain-containing protein [Jatrophihabitans lederbergiae]|uniref:CBS domain-containing protein n=1 Tax=Jatrophihabitans lederbergiae TaxID=3075547 RepID=A0ABU2JD26_9ACTN|nr:CBS domain-containing protein [Jatrophihabitans sp. DSM 44399]MDT0262885.1 CBS domain-containing protein [Jatrophihabitans sp. DSM 44399]